MIIAVGVSHKTAPVAVREKLAFAKQNIQPALVGLRKAASGAEAALLSTCNRTEFYVGIDNPVPVIEWWRDALQLTQADLDPYLYHFTNEAAVKHVMRVASGLDSMILGEPQILGQLKLAYQEAMNSGTLGKNLTRLFQSSFSVAKKIRTETDIAKHPVSIAYAATNLAKRIFSDLSKARVLLIGSGENMELVALHLSQIGVHHLTVANHRIAGAKRLANRFGGDAILLKKVPEILQNVDIVISSTASPSWVLTQEQVEQALKSRKRHPIFMVDLAIPCDIDPKVSQHDDIYLYTIDDLQNQIEENMALRTAEAEVAERIIECQVAQYMAWLHSREAINALCSFREKFEIQKQELVTKAMQQLASGGNPEDIIQQLAHSLTQKFMHYPTYRLRQAGKNKESQTLDLITELFELDV